MGQDHVARRTKEDAARTREELLDAAEEVFLERGVSRPSLCDIAARAGLTRGAIYVHFENKADLFSALLDRFLLPAEALSSWNPEAGTPLQRLHAACLYLMRETAEDAHWRRMLDIVFHKCEKLEENGAIVQRLRASRSGTMAHMEGLLREAIAAGDAPSDLDVGLAIELLHACVVGTMSQWLVHARDVDLAAHAAPFADALVHMVLTAPSLRRAADAG
ncbi:MAG: TetR family transcriptional regulator [Alphaproteobacteria bacterium]|nr:TetR family transcriptional regulator [Alphaproteobacteria bacterium]